MNTYQRGKCPPRLRRVFFCSDFPVALPLGDDVRPQHRPHRAGGDVPQQPLDGADGVIHYSYYLPSSYDGAKTYPLVVTMPGYDRMWFGADSAGTNLSWNGVQAWTKLDTEVIVVSAQLTDWGDTSARQANELAEYMIENFSVDTSRVYAAGYSAGGETMSRAVAMRPDLYAAYIHGGSQWDGAFDTVAENRVAVYIFMAEHDEYYGSQKARDAYAGLHDAYAAEGLTEAEIDALLKLEIPDDAYFNDRGIYNYHGGGSPGPACLFHEDRNKFIVAEFPGACKCPLPGQACFFPPPGAYSGRLQLCEWRAFP